MATNNETPVSDLDTGRKNLATSIHEERPLGDGIVDHTSGEIHTSFPVNLKEVFELTNSGSDLSQPLLQQNDPDQENEGYMVPSPLILESKHQNLSTDYQKTDSNGIEQNHGVSSDPDSPVGPHPLWKSSEEKELNSSVNEQCRWISVVKTNASTDNGSSSPRTVINLSVANERIVYPQLSSEPYEAYYVERRRSWPDITDDNPVEEQSNNERIIGRPVNDVHMSNFVTISPPTHSTKVSESGQINRNNIRPYNFTVERCVHPVSDPLSQSNVVKKDASCQVDDESCPIVHKNDVPFKNRSLSLIKNASASSKLHPPSQNMSVVSGETERSLHVSNQGVVLDGIKPEMYVQEHNLIVEPRAKKEDFQKSDMFSCTRCGKVFCDSRSLQRHMQVHVGARAYHCPVCDKGFMLKGDLTRHMRIHSGEKPYVCDICNRRFTLKGNLMQHFRTHTPDKQYRCTICSKNYAQKDSLHRHIRAHFGDKPFQCTVCFKRFTLKADLSRHILIHSGVKPHTCNLCGRMFALKGNLTQHLRIHVKSKANNSEYSQKNSSSQQSATNNSKVESFHANATVLQKPTLANNDGLINPENDTNTVVSVNSFLPVSSSSACDSSLQSSGLAFCSACSRTFSSPESLQEHVQLVHEQLNRLPMNRYMCNICQKEFPLKGDLTRHLNSHNGVKPYQCDQCDRMFTLKSNLRQHQTTHALDKSFACPLCCKLFGNRRNLSLHLRRHEQANANFTCTRCGRSFLAKSDHFFHNCMKGETSASPERSNTGPVNSGSSFSPLTSSSNYHNAATTDESIEPPPITSSVDLYEVKKEISQVSCNIRELISNPDGLPVNCLNAGESFLSPFYRHLYFATSQQSVLPSLKGFLHTQPEENNICYNKIVKES